MPDTGPFVWHELRVPDLDEAVRFYGAVFGWTFVDNPMGKTITHRGVVIGGANAVKAGLDTHWTPYIACACRSAMASDRSGTVRIRPASPILQERRTGRPAGHP